MTELPLTGGCLCGGVRFEVSERPVSAGYCHCTRCRRRTGTAASLSARIVPGSLRILSGEELIRSYDPPDGFSKVFCSGCGSQLWSQSQEDPDVISVRFGSFDDDPGIRPSYRQFVSYSAPWEPIPDDGLPLFPEHRSTDA
ncbi:MAG TPA: GFA family protein [Gaiellaceae bacterium]